jgi:hypothetical protein
MPEQSFRLADNVQVLYVLRMEHNKDFRLGSEVTAFREGSKIVLLREGKRMELDGHRYYLEGIEYPTGIDSDLWLAK